VVYSVLGINIFDLPEVAEPEIGDAKLQIKGGGSVLGYGLDKSEGFVVLKGTRCLKKEVPSFSKGSRTLRASLLGRAVLKEEGDFFLFSQDYVFTSPSQAADIILGRSANGRMEWKNSSGLSLKEIQEAA